MADKYFRYVWIFVAVAAVLFGMSVYRQYNSDAGKIRGQYAFAQTRDNIKLLQHIKMTTPESGEVNLEFADGDWRFKEAKGYFINVNRLADFYAMVNSALIETVNPAAKETLEKQNLTPETGTVVITYDNTGNVLDEMIIGKRYDDDSVYAYSEKNKGYYYIIGPVGAFAGGARDWIPYPLLSIDGGRIRRMILRGHLFEGEKLEQLMQSSFNMQRALGVLSFIGYDGVSLKSDLAEDKYADIKPRTLDIVMDNGLIYAFEIYEIEDLYWLGITLKVDKISRKGVASFVKQNQKYFADWLFLMDTRQGRTLYKM
ncbi:MAG: DUF4340 domain-containing protein [Alphaproteobacteria bacterium]|nr:DUF4340 domain-containing protein [Alphaproteobacteria bacterium]